jgi:hypothetical protein
MRLSFPQMDPMDRRRARDATTRGGQGTIALVIFEDRADSLASRVLRPGYRHCFCVVGTGSVWTVCDPLKTRVELTPLQGPTGPELVAHFAASGRAVLVGHVSPDRSARPLRLRPLSCVEVVKRVLNVDLGWVATPFQLCRALLALPAPHGPFVPGSANFGVDRALK